MTQWVQPKIWVGFLGVPLGLGGKIAPCLKLVRIILETWNLVCKYSHICSFRKYIPFSAKQRFQLSRIFRDYPEIKHHVPKSRNTINLYWIQAFSSTFEENPKFLFFHSPKNLFFYKLTSYSSASSTIFKYFKSRRWCLFKNSSSSVLLPWKPHPEPLGPARRL